MTARPAPESPNAPDRTGGGAVVSGPGAPAPILRTRVFDEADLRRAVTRIAHEIVERNHGGQRVVLVGLYTRGVALAQRLAAAIASFEGVDVPVGMLDVAFYRDDIGLRPVAPLGPTEVPDVSGRIVVLVDDVLYHRAAPRAPRSTRCSSSAGPERSSSRCSSTAATGNCRSAPTTSARTCPTKTRRGRAGAARRGRRRRTTASRSGESRRRVEPREAPAVGRRPRRQRS